MNDGIYLLRKLTRSLKALRRKKDLQLSHDIASKLYPSAGAPHITQINELVFVFFGWDG